MIVFSANGKRALNYGLDFTGGTSTEMVFSSSADIPANADLEKFVSDTLGKKQRLYRFLQIMHQLSKLMNCHLMSSRN